MTIEEYNESKDGFLRYGITTGTCACAAASAALLLYFGESIDIVRVDTPAGISLDIPIESLSYEGETVCSQVKKYAGDDPDMTDGMYIGASLLLCAGEERKIYFHAGEGVGIVTKAGLDQPVGEAAINRIPREMISLHLIKICQTYGFIGRIDVTVFAIGGEEVAKKTFNPRLGIVGGISILGTSGIVHPMSKQAILDTIRTDIQVYMKNTSPYIIASPGNMGEKFAKQYLEKEDVSIVLTSNFLGDSLDMAVEAGAKGMLLIGNIGKLVKLAGGIMDTHSNSADARLEILAAHVLRYSEDMKGFHLAKHILDANTTIEAVEILKTEEIFHEVMDSLVVHMYTYALKRAHKAYLKKDKQMNQHAFEKNFTLAILVCDNENQLLAKYGDIGVFV